MRVPSLPFALLLCYASCTSSSSSPSPQYQFADNWLMGGSSERIVTCVPYGEPLTLRGTIVVRPFRKGLDGAVLRVNAREEWILAYRAEGVLLELDGQSVEVTGRACEKKWQAMSGKHFDLATLAVL